MMRDITARDLMDKIECGANFILLDVRDKSEYGMEHLPGAVHILISDMNEQSLKRFDTDVEIVTYSEDFDCSASRIAAEKLEEAGFKVLNYQGSFDGWKEKRYPTEKRAAQINPA
jgi:rhodanese-related sulfurtransferase